MSRVSRQDISRVIAGLSFEGNNKELPYMVAAYLLDQRRIEELDSILRDVQKDWVGFGYVDVLAKLARPLPQQVYTDLANSFRDFYPKAQTINVTPVIDESVIGGVILELAEQRMDISIKRRLRRFKKVINVKEGY